MQCSRVWGKALHGLVLTWSQEGPPGALKASLRPASIRTGGWELCPDSEGLLSKGSGCLPGAGTPLAVGQSQSCALPAGLFPHPLLQFLTSPSHTVGGDKGSLCERGRAEEKASVPAPEAPGPQGRVGSRGDPGLQPALHPTVGSFPGPHLRRRTE